MKTEDRKAIASMIRALDKFERAQLKMSLSGWSRLCQHMTLEEVATWVEVEAVKDALIRFLADPLFFPLKRKTIFWNRDRFPSPS